MGMATGTGTGMAMATEMVEEMVEGMVEEMAEVEEALDRQVLALVDVGEALGLVKEEVVVEAEAIIMTTMIACKLRPQPTKYSTLHFVHFLVSTVKPGSGSLSTWETSIIRSL